MHGRQGAEQTALIREMIALANRHHVEYSDGEATVVEKPALPRD